MPAPSISASTARACRCASEETRGRRGKQPDGSAKTREAKIVAVWSADTLDRDGRPARDPGSVTYSGAIETIASRDTDTEPSPFAGRALREAERRCFDAAPRRAVLGDGAPWIWNWADEHAPGAIQIVDIFHAKGHLFDVAKAVYGAGTDLADRGGKQRRDELDQGRIDDILAALRSHAETSDDARKCVDYIDHNRDRMRYPEFRAMGLCVATGVVEGGCKNIVASRLKRGGMHWTVDGANAIMALRCAILSDPHGGCGRPGRRVGWPGRCARWVRTSERRFAGTVSAVVFVGAPVGAGVALVFAPSMHEQPVGVAVLDGVGEIAQHIVERGDGFDGEIVGQRQTDVGVRGSHCRSPDGLGTEFVDGVLHVLGVDGAGLGDRGGRQGIVGDAVDAPRQSAGGLEQGLDGGRLEQGSSEPARRRRWARYASISSRARLPMWWLSDSWTATDSLRRSSVRPTSSMHRRRSASMPKFVRSLRSSRTSLRRCWASSTIRTGSCLASWTRRVTSLRMAR